MRIRGSTGVVYQFLIMKGYDMKVDRYESNHICKAWELNALHTININGYLINGYLSDNTLLNLRFTTKYPSYWETNIVAKDYTIYLHKDDCIWLRDELLKFFPLEEKEEKYYLIRKDKYNNYEVLLQHQHSQPQLTRIANFVLEDDAKEYIKSKNNGSLA